MNPETIEIHPPVTRTNTEVAETYLEAIRSKDPSKAMFAPDVTLLFPLTPRKIVGKQSVIDYMVSLLPGIDDVKLERHMIGGEYVATLWQAQTVWGELPICSVFRISDGLIQEVRSFWDPRPVLPQARPTET
jgi:SnoaL-like protein